MCPGGAEGGKKEEKGAEGAALVGTSGKSPGTRGEKEDPRVPS